MFLFGDSSSFLYFCSSLGFFVGTCNKQIQSRCAMAKQMSSYPTTQWGYIPTASLHVVSTRTAIFPKKIHVNEMFSLFIYIYVYSLHITMYYTYISNITSRAVCFLLLGKSCPTNRGFGATKDTNLSEHCTTRWGEGTGMGRRAGFWRIRKKQGFSGIHMGIQGIYGYPWPGSFHHKLIVGLTQ